MATSHKLDDFKSITIENLSTRGIYYYQSAKSLAKYLAPPSENAYTIKDTLNFLTDEVLVSYVISFAFYKRPPWGNHRLYFSQDPQNNENKLPHLSNNHIFLKRNSEIYARFSLLLRWEFVQTSWWMQYEWSVVACDCKRIRVQARTWRSYS